MRSSAPSAALAEKGVAEPLFHATSNAAPRDAVPQVAASKLESNALQQAMPDRPVEHAELSVAAQNVPPSGPLRGKAGPTAPQTVLPEPAVPSNAPASVAAAVASPPAAEPAAEAARPAAAPAMPAVIGKMPAPPAAGSGALAAPAEAVAQGQGGFGGQGDSSAGGQGRGLNLDAAEAKQSPEPLREDSGYPGGRQSELPAQQRTAELSQRVSGQRGGANDPSELVRKLLGDRLAFPVRQYAYEIAPENRPSPSPPPTLFWHPLLTADALGRTRIHFDLPDRLATYRVQVTAHADGRIGSGTAEIRVEPGEALYQAVALTPAEAFTQGIEGPACDREGNVYAVNFQREGTIGRVTPDGKADLFVALPEGSTGNAIRIDPQGRAFVADYTGHQILRIDLASRRVETLVAEPQFHQPNDLTRAADGTLFASDPDWENATGQIWRITPAGEAARVAEGLGTTNGIALSPDGHTLYVSESEQRHVWAFPVEDGGRLGAKRLLCAFPDHGLDGIRADVAGDLYVTRHGKGTVAQISPEGKTIREIGVLGSRPSNLCFGGRDGRTVYVTEVEHRRIVRFRVERPGLEWQQMQE